MRYVRIPKPAVLNGVTPGADGKVPTLSLLTLVRDTLGTQAAWRADDTTAGIYLDIVDSLEQWQDPGDTVKLTDEAHEKLLAVMRSFEPSPMFALPYMRLFKAVSSAPKSLEEPAKTAPANGAVTSQ